MKTTINIMDHNGNLIDLSQRVLETFPTLNQPSILDTVTKPTGKDFKGGYNPGYIYKKAKRSSSDVAGATNIGIPATRAGYSTQWLGRKFIDKVIREDNIIGSLYDYELLKEGKGGDILIKEVGDFILENKEKDLRELFTKLSTQANAMKLYSSVTKKNTGDAYAIVPGGAQPAQTATKTADAITALQGGKRSVIADDFATGDNLINLVREMVAYLNELGTEKSLEKFYPWSINGIGLENMVIESNYRSIVKIKDSLTTTVVNLNDPGSVRNLNGLVGFIDTIPVYISNQIGKDTILRVHSNRAFVRDVDTTTNYIGKIKVNAGAVKLANGEVHNVGPDEVLMQFFSPRRMGVAYEEESFEVKSK